MSVLKGLGMIILVVSLTACAGNSADVGALFASETEDIYREIRAETGDGESTAGNGPGQEAEAVETFRENGGENSVLKIRVSGKDQIILFELNDSMAARGLYESLPLTVQVEDYGSNEKIFYPPEKLETRDTPLTEGGDAGSLAYFAPWGNVVMYYGSFGPYSGLYELGTAVSGSEAIVKLSGEILIEAAE